jgi:hypothetical protein
MRTQLQIVEALEVQALRLSSSGGSGLGSALDLYFSRKAPHEDRELFYEIGIEGVPSDAAVWMIRLAAAVRLLRRSINNVKVVEDLYQPGEVVLRVGRGQKEQAGRAPIEYAERLRQCVDELSGRSVVKERSADYARGREITLAEAQFKMGPFEEIEEARRMIAERGAKSEADMVLEDRIRARTIREIIDWLRHPTGGRDPYWEASDGLEVHFVFEKRGKASQAKEGQALPFKRVPAGAMTMEEVEIACQNIGYDLACGSCAEIFFTGGAWHGEHDPECSTAHPRKLGVVMTLGPSPEICLCAAPMPSSVARVCANCGKKQETG